jgi:hypothetical protein
LEELRVFARLDEGTAGLMVHYPSLTVPASDPGKLLVTYTRSYSDHSGGGPPSPAEDEGGIWLAEMDIPAVGAEDGAGPGGAGGVQGFPVRSIAIVGPGESARNDGSGGGSGGGGTGAHDEVALHNSRGVGSEGEHIGIM